MQSKLHYLGAALLSISCGVANAALVVTAGPASPGLTTSKTNVCTVDFNTLASLASCAGASYSANAGAHIVSGDLGGQYAAPDNTPYLTVGGNLSDTVTITIAAGANYFGFYAGSIDSYNSITFSNATDTFTLTGNQLVGGAANASQAGYFNLMSNVAFTSIALNSSSAAFETDNHSFGTVPEPASIALLGIGLVGLGAAKRRRAK